MLINDLTLLLDLFGNSEGTKLLIWTVIFCLVFTAPEKWRVELRAKTGHYRNRCLFTLSHLGLKLGINIFLIKNVFLRLNNRIKPKSDIHCNRSATSPRPKFKTIAEVAEESQLGFAVGHRLVGDWSATNWGLVADWSATGRRPRGDLFATCCNWSPTGRGPVPD